MGEKWDLVVKEDDSVGKQRRRLVDGPVIDSLYRLLPVQIWPLVTSACMFQQRQRSFFGGKRGCPEEIRLHILYLMLVVTGQSTIHLQIISYIFLLREYTNQNRTLGSFVCMLIALLEHAESIEYPRRIRVESEVSVMGRTGISGRYR